MQYSREVEEMFCVAKGAKHDPAPIPEEGKWVKAKEITDIFGLTHGVGWCAPQQGAMQADAEHKGRHNRRSTGGDDRLLRHDAFRCNGGGDTARQDHIGSA